MKLNNLPISLLGGFVLLLFCLLPVTGAADNQGSSPVRSLHIIDTDNAGAKLAYPSTIYYDAEADEIYITDAAKGQVVICASDYFPQLAVGKGRGLQTIYSSYVKDEKVYFCVGQSEKDLKGHIAVYNQALFPEKKIYFSGFPGAENFLPREMVTGKNGLLYVVGVNATAVIVLDQEGNFLREILPKDEMLGVQESAMVYSLTQDSNGRLYLLSESHGRVFVYDQDENFLFKFGQKGGGRGKLARPRGIAVDVENNKVFIVDYLRHTASVYSTSGDFLFEFGGIGYSRGWFYFPTDVCVDGRGRVLITDTFNHRVQVFKIIGRQTVQVSGADVFSDGSA
jgi:DNA-binding beta-propeller fold protein YncE